MSVTRGAQAVLDALERGGEVRGGELVSPEARAAERETVVAAAIRTKSVFNECVLVFSVGRPGRHCDLMSCGDRAHREEQGFVTSLGRFVNRREGWKIAEAAGQVKARPGGDYWTLFSKDLW